MRKLLWKNSNWTITAIDGKALEISDNWIRCFAYVNEDYTKLVFDVIRCPKYIQKKALTLAKKNIRSIYA